MRGIGTRDFLLIKPARDDRDGGRPASQTKASLRQAAFGQTSKESRGPEFRGPEFRQLPRLSRLNERYFVRRQAIETIDVAIHISFGGDDPFLDGGQRAFAVDDLIAYGAGRGRCNLA